MLEQASVLEGSPVHTSGLARLAYRPWLSVDVSAERALAAASDSSLADGHDYYLNRLVLWRGAGSGSRITHLYAAVCWREPTGLEGAGSRTA